MGSLGYRTSGAPRGSSSAIDTRSCAAESRRCSAVRRAARHDRHAGSVRTRSIGRRAPRALQARCTRHAAHVHAVRSHHTLPAATAGCRFAVGYQYSGPIGWTSIATAAPSPRRSPWGASTTSALLLVHRFRDAWRCGRALHVLDARWERAVAGDPGQRTSDSTLCGSTRSARWRPWLMLLAGARIGVAVIGESVRKQSAGVEAPTGTSRRGCRGRHGRPPDRPPNTGKPTASNPAVAAGSVW